MSALPLPAAAMQTSGAVGAVSAPSFTTPLDPALPAEIRTRVPLALARAAEKAAAATGPAHRSAALLQAGQRARTTRQRVVWLQRWGEAHVAPLTSVAACQRGCAHCCHIAVQITSVEADLIAAATSRRAATPSTAIALSQVDVDDPQTAQRWQEAERQVVGTPCPFLINNECSVHEHRPFACRTHLSLDDDDLLCRLGDSVDIPMPRLDVRLPVGYFLSAQPDAVIADIRAFFPLGPHAAGEGRALEDEG